MKEPTFLLTAALVGMTMAPAPVQAQAAKVSVIQIGSSSEDYNSGTESIKEYLSNCQFGDNQIITIPTLCENLKDFIYEIKLPDCENGDITETPDSGNNGDITESPDNGNNGGVTETPGNGNNGDITETPDNGNNGGVTETPDNGNNGDITESPDNGNNGDITETPDNDSTEDTTSDYHAYVLRVVELVNEARAEAGLNPVSLAEDVTAAAQVRAVEIVTSFSHTRPNGTSCFTALEEAGVNYRGAGENIAWGQRTPEEVMNGWMNSAGHRANILNGSFTTIGVGYYQNASGVNYWTQMFTY